MRSNDVFGRMSAEQAQQFLADARETAPEVASLALGAAAQAFRLRPQFIKKQPRTKQADWVRRALARSASAQLAEEILAAYFLDHHDALLVELLDALEVPHEEGRLMNENPVCPAPAALEKAVAAFRGGDAPERRELLLLAFAAQSAIDWPDLEKLLG